MINQHRTNFKDYKEFFKDCESFKAEKQNYHLSYKEFIKYFENIFENKNLIGKHHLIIGINFTYGWMPTILDFRSENFDEAIEILNKAKKEGNLEIEDLNILMHLFNNSLVGTSKLLHFINPEKFAIWDSRVCRYLTGNNNPTPKQLKPKYYLQFLNYITNLTQKEEYDTIHDSICAKLNLDYSMTKLRSAELVMYSKGSKIVNQ